MNLYGYICLPSAAMDKSAQLNALCASGVSEGNILVDTGIEQGKERPAFQKLIERMESGDRVVITGIESLGQSYNEIVDCLTFLIKEKHINVTVLDMPLLSSATSHGAMDGLVSEIMLELLTYLTQKERSIRREKQADGISAAKARGVRFGKPALERPEGYETIREMWESGDLSARTAARQLNVSHQTFLKWAKSESRPN